MNKKILSIIIVNILLSIAIFIVGMFMLPENLVVQISVSNTNSTMPKLLGLLLPLLLNIILSFLYIKSKNNKYLIGVFICYFGYTFLFIVNLLF